MAAQALTLRRIPWLPWQPPLLRHRDFGRVRCFSTSSSAAPSPPLPSSSTSFFPKKNQTLELVCESLAFQGKGVCRVEGTGFVVLCDRALPGERFVGRVTRKKGSHAEVKKISTISPHSDAVAAPCEYAGKCGGCRTQNLLYGAQVASKEQQVRDLIVRVGRFPEESLALKPIVPCSIKFNYRNKMEFSFGTKRLITSDEDEDGHALGLHAPGFFDKILHVGKCLLQSEAANEVLSVVQSCWRDSHLGLSPYDARTHKGYLKHLMIRTGRLAL